MSTRSLIALRPLAAAVRDFQQSGWQVPLLLIAYAMRGYAADSQSAPNLGDAPDYSQTLTWICRPGADDACTADQDAVIVYADGHKILQPFEAAKNPAI